MSEAIEATMKPCNDATEAYFWANVGKKGPDECWLWLGKCDQGYGFFSFGGKRWRRVHRLSLMLSGREIPDGLVVDHTCRNRACVNPRHLRTVTPRTNTIENSISVTAINAKKTHCPNGHEYTAENTRICHRRGSTFRICRQCHRAYCLAYKQRKVAELGGWRAFNNLYRKSRALAAQVTK